MASVTTLCKKLLGGKSTVMVGHGYYQYYDDVNNSWHEKIVFPIISTVSHITVTSGHPIPCAILTETSPWSKSSTERIALNVLNTSLRYGCFLDFSGKQFFKGFVIAAVKTMIEVLTLLSRQKTPEQLTVNPQTRISMIVENNSLLYRENRIKETLRLLLKIKNVVEPGAELHWCLLWTSQSQQDSCFTKLYKWLKIIIWIAYSFLRA